MDTNTNFGDEINIVNSQEQDSGTAPQIPEEPDGWQDTFKAFGIEEVDSWETAYQTFAQSREAASQIGSIQDQLSQKDRLLSEMEAKTKVSPFANEFSKTIDDMVRNGAKSDEISRFVEIQGINTESLTDEQAIKRLLRLQTPGATESEITAFYEKKYGLDSLEEGETLDQATGFQIKQDAIEAKKVIQGKKVEVSKIDAVVQREQREGQQKQLFADWSQFNDKHLIATQSIKLSEESHGVNLEFKIPERTRANIVRKASELAAQGLWEPTQENWEKVTAFAHNAAIVQHLGDFVKTIVTQVKSEAEAAVAARKGNLPPNPDGEGNPPPIPRGEGQKTYAPVSFEKIKPSNDGFI